VDKFVVFLVVCTPGNCKLSTQPIVSPVTCLHVPMCIVLSGMNSNKINLSEPSFYSTNGALFRALFVVNSHHWYLILDWLVLRWLTLSISLDCSFIPRLNWMNAGTLSFDLIFMTICELWHEATVPTYNWFSLKVRVMGFWPSLQVWTSTLISFYVLYINARDIH